MNKTLPSSSWLWSELRDLFETDNGYLPEIRVNYSDVKATAQGFAILSSRASAVIPKNPSFWSITDAEERPLASVPNPAVLVASGEAESFHVVFGGIRSCGVVVPDIGVFVFPDQLALDYRMGVAWGVPEINALFALLSELSVIDPKASFSLEEGTLPAVAARFQNAWNRYNESNDA